MCGMDGCAEVYKMDGCVGVHTHYSGTGDVLQSREFDKVERKKDLGKQRRQRSTGEKTHL